MQVCHCVVTNPTSVLMSPVLGGFLEKGAGSPSLRIIMEQKMGGERRGGVSSNTQLIGNFYANPMAETLI